MSSHHVRTSQLGLRALAALLGLVLLAAACSSDDSGSDDEASSDDSTPADDAAVPDLGDLPYADTGWVTLHGDPANRKYQPAATTADDYDSWQGLQHTSVLAAPSSGLDGQLFVTSGLAAGSSNLHAFDETGALLWEAEPWAADGSGGPDPCALLNTAIVDDDGDLYVSDCDQVWAFHPDGEVKWTADLPAPPADSAYADDPLQPNSFLTATFQPDGSVVGVTLFGEVVVLDRETGEAVAEPFALPSVPQALATDPPLPPGAFGGGEAAPEILDLTWQVAFGGNVVSANTPAVDTDGRLFVVAGGSEPTAGVLYGIDVDGGEVSIAFETPVGVGSGCSPTLSPEEDVVYTCDNQGTLYAASTDDGEVLWTVEDAESEAGSVAVGPDGNVYILVRNGTYKGYTDEGELLWEADFTTLDDPLPENEAVGPKVFIGAGNPTVVAEGDALIVALNRGYQFEVAGRTPNVPIIAELVELDTETGEAVRTLTTLDNPTEGIIHVDPDGRIVSSQGAITTTSPTSLSPTIDPLLTDGLTVIPPGGGIEVFDPA